MRTTTAFAFLVFTVMMTTGCCWIKHSGGPGTQLEPYRAYRGSDGGAAAVILDDSTVYRFNPRFLSIDGCVPDNGPVRHLSLKPGKHVLMVAWSASEGGARSGPFSPIETITLDVEANRRYVFVPNMRDDILGPPYITSWQVRQE